AADSRFAGQRHALGGSDADHRAAQARSARRHLLSQAHMPRRRAVIGGLMAGAVLSSPASALAKLLSVGRRPAETFTLANGLQVVVLPSARAPIVSQVVVYKVGSADETLGHTGIAHFLEH